MYLPLLNVKKYVKKEQNVFIINLSDVFLPIFCVLNMLDVPTKTHHKNTSFFPKNSCVKVNFIHFIQIITLFWEK